MLDTQNQGPQCTACGSSMKLTAIRVRRLPVVNRAKRFVGILSIGNLSIGNVATLASHGEALSRLSRPCEENTQIG